MLTSPTFLSRRKGWAGFRHIDEDRLDYRHVGSDRHAVIEEAGVIEPAVPVVDVLLVEGPADALWDAALDLPLDIGGVGSRTRHPAPRQTAGSSPCRSRGRPRHHRRIGSRNPERAADVNRGSGTDQPWRRASATQLIRITIAGSLIPAARAYYEWCPMPSAPRVSAVREFSAKLPLMQRPDDRCSQRPLSLLRGEFEGRSCTAQTPRHCHSATGQSQGPRAHPM